MRCVASSGLIFCGYKVRGGSTQIKGTVRGLAQWVYLRPNPVLAIEKKFSPFHFKDLLSCLCFC